MHVERVSSAHGDRGGVDIGIALDGDGHLGRPGAVSALAQAADRLDYGSIWCLGPWATTLAGAVAAVTTRIRIGVEPRSIEGLALAETVAPGRLVVAELPPIWVTSSTETPIGGTVRVDLEAGQMADVAEVLTLARRLSVDEVVVHRIDDPTLDDALACFAAVATLAERTERHLAVERGRTTAGGRVSDVS